MPVIVVEHPLVKQKLGLLRNNDTSTSQFRAAANEIAMLLAYEATKNLPVEEKTAQGWAGPTRVCDLAGGAVTVVPILRAGLGLLDGVLNLMPSAPVSVVGLYRNESTLEPVEYYAKLAKNLPERGAIILDPMLATGGSMLAAIDILRRHGCGKISAITVVCAPEGINNVLGKYPQIDIFTASVDEKLNADGYILPGLGDAGDRLFGTR